jgi:ankyrin repeat protein
MMLSRSVRTGVLIALICALVRVIDGAAADTRLIDAVRRVDADAVRRLIEQKVDVNVTQPDGATALHWAAHRNDVAIADLLLKAGAKVDAADEGGVTPLGLASLNASPAMVERLLKAGASPNTGRETPVLSAARTGNVEVMKLLLAHGGDANAKEPGRGQTALMWAAAERHAPITRVLIEHGADVKAKTIPVRTAGPGRGTFGGLGGGMGGASNGANGYTALLFAARAGDLASVRLLADAGANVNDASADGMSALVLATVRAHVDVALFLLEKGADANLAGAGFTALHWASGSWETELTVTSITPDREGEEWRTVAGLRERRVDLVKALLAHGADPNARIRRPPQRVGSSKNPGLPELVGATPFLIAAVGGAADVMRVLADHGADVRLNTSANGTPLMAAAGLGRAIGEVLVPESDNLAAAQLLFELGAVDVNAVDTLGNSALHYAAFMRRDSIVQLLADRGARLDVPNLYGETPLFLAEVVIQFAGGGRTESGPTSTGTLLRKLGAKPAKPAYTLRPHYWPNIPHV